MDRIGVFREASRLENRRMFLTSPVPFWRRVFWRKTRLALGMFGLLCFLSGFAAGKAQAVPAGSVQYALECIPRVPASGTSLAPCVNVGTVGYRPVQVQSYVIDSASASYIDQLTTPFDYALGSAFWAFGFSGVMILYFSSHVIGLVLKKVRNG